MWEGVRQYPALNSVFGPMKPEPTRPSAVIWPRPAGIQDHPTSLAAEGSSAIPPDRILAIAVLLPARLFSRRYGVGLDVTNEEGIGTWVRGIPGARPGRCACRRRDRTHQLQCRRAQPRADGHLPRRPAVED